MEKTDPGHPAQAMQSTESHGLGGGLARLGVDAVLLSIEALNPPLAPAPAPASESSRDKGELKGKGNGKREEQEIAAFSPAFSAIGGKPWDAAWTASNNPGSGSGSGSSSSSSSGARKKANAPSYRNADAAGGAVGAGCPVGASLVARLDSALGGLGGLARRGRDKVCIQLYKWVYIFTCIHIL